MRGPMVGRAAEAEAVRSAYERTLAGQRAVVLVSGEAGIGKSRLLSTVVATLPDDPLVLSGGCLELGSEGAPYLPFVAVLRDLIRHVGRDQVTGLLPLDGTALGDLLPALGPAPLRYGRTRLLEEMLTLVTEVARAQPVVLVVEDLHWADASSRELFAYLARNLTGNVLLIGSLRTGELSAGHPNRQLLAELGRRAEVTRIDLGPLTHHDVAQLLAAVDGGPPDPVRSARIHQRSGGNPLFAEALSSGETAPAGDLRALLLERITRLPDAAREALAVLAVAGAGLTDEFLADAGLVEVQVAVSNLVGRDLVVVARDGYRIRHDLIREAVYASVLPARRRRLHAQYAEALAAQASGMVTDTVAMAEHWTAAGEMGRALPAAWHAAELAAHQNAFDEQLHLLELILVHWTEVPDPADAVGADRTTVLEHAAEAALAAGRSASGIRHSTAALGGLDPATHPQRTARLLGLRGQLRTRVDGTGADDLEQAVELLPPGASDALRGWLVAALGFVCVGAYRLDDSRRYAEEALAIATRLGDDSLRARALLVSAALDGAAGRIEPARRSFADSRRLAETAGDEHTFLTTFQWEADLVETTGHYEEAAALAHEGRLAAERLGLARSRGSMLAVAQAVPLLLLGRWDEAVQVVEDTLQLEPPPLYGAFLRLVAADIARRRGQTGRFEALLRGLTEFAQRAQAASEAVAGIVVQRVAWALDSGEADLADRIVRDHLHSAWPARETMRLLLLGARAQRARRAAAPRNRRLAAECAARLAELSRLGDTAPANAETRAYRLTLRALTVADALSTWDEAAAAWRDLGDPYETATTLTDAAATALASNNRPGAAARLREAQALAADLAAAPLLARIDDLTSRGRLAEPPNTPPLNDFGLTRRELDVLRVVARGRSNAQIAEELFISTNTVATHVARILGKLDATTRTEAVTRARETGILDA
ncbi:AAA family ATPase [Kutzneria buriramensis]|uniref:Regulatory LuxR family protein n=1 Tax=Kutzneria buriramensis TaxID=1045776 RepID=A0A3E0HIS0_9PSEU|nr:helix-turn-helix transcriptional regulator [Kutzneria buriramensis]REH46308.1 regulatory LuxR family protein [Kutzneria buriramensis]